MSPVSFHHIDRIMCALTASGFLLFVFRSVWLFVCVCVFHVLMFSFIGHHSLGFFSLLFLPSSLFSSLNSSLSSSLSSSLYSSLFFSLYYPNLTSLCYLPHQSTTRVTTSRARPTCIPAKSTWACAPLPHWVAVSNQIAAEIAQPNVTVTPPHVIRMQTVS